jgi:hypothetical protein
MNLQHIDPDDRPTPFEVSDAVPVAAPSNLPRDQVAPALRRILSLITAPRRTP